MLGTSTSASGSWQLLDQGGRTVVITGANSGLGFSTALAFARRNARVVLACRNRERAEMAALAISEQTGNSNIDFCVVALDDLESVHLAAGQLLARESRIDLLINNAGAMISEFSVSAEGVEMNMAVNYLGHFAWTGLLMPRLLAAPSSRVVGLGSLGHFLSIGFPPKLVWPPNTTFRSLIAYAHSKLAVLLFTQALQRRLSDAQADVKAVAAHPGGARTELIRSRMSGLSPSLARKFLQFQSADDGAMPVLRAACDLDVSGGEYFGPSGLFQVSGRPVAVRGRPKVGNEQLQDELWATSEQLSQVRFQLK